MIFSLVSLRVFDRGPPFSSHCSFSGFAASVKKAHLSPPFFTATSSRLPFIALPPQRPPSPFFTSSSTSYFRARDFGGQLAYVPLFLFVTISMLAFRMRRSQFCFFLWSRAFCAPHTLRYFLFYSFYGVRSSFFLPDPAKTILPPEQSVTTRHPSSSLPLSPFPSAVFGLAD